MRVLVVFGGLLVPAAANAQQKTLNISPRAQDTPVWCWAAVGEMVFRHYGVSAINPYYQCGIVAGLGPACWASCGNCVVPAGQMSTIAAMIHHYPRLAEQTTGQSNPDLDAETLAATIAPDEIVAEIDNDRPIIAGISPSGMSYPGGLAEHVALIIGYRRTAGDLQLIVNDPFPFQAGADPYLRAGAQQLQPGRYRIAHSAFVTRLGWNSSILIVD